MRNNEEDKKKVNNPEEDKEDEKNEEDLIKMIEQLTKQTSTTQIVRSSIFFHPNLGMHVLISFIINLISAIVIIGITDAIQPLVIWNAGSFFLAVTLFTLISNVLSITLAYLLIKRVLLFYGFIHFGVQLFSFFLIPYITNNMFNFTGSNNNIFVNLIIFTMLFVIMNYLLSLLYRKVIYQNIKRKR